LAPFPSASLRAGTRHIASYEHQNFLNVSRSPPALPFPALPASTRYPRAPAPTLIGCKFLKNRPGGRNNENHRQRGAIIHRISGRSTALSHFCRTSGIRWVCEDLLPTPSRARAAKSHAGRSRISLPLQ